MYSEAMKLSEIPIILLLLLLVSFSFFRLSKFSSRFKVENGLLKLFKISNYLILSMLCGLTFYKFSCFENIESLTFRRLKSISFPSYLKAFAIAFLLFSGLKDIELEIGRDIGHFSKGVNLFESSSSGFI